MIRNIKRFLLNVPGWHTKRKIVVFESDDWGSIRMPSLAVQKKLQSKGVKLDYTLGYDSYDTLASADDLQKLFGTCNDVKDKNGNPAIITANCVVANPDFNKIRMSDFNDYHYELITDTMLKYYPQSSIFDNWKLGIEQGVFYPQFHGREHINVQMWMNALKNNIEDTRFSFDNNYAYINLLKKNDIRQKNNSAFNYQKESELPFLEEAIVDGLRIFENLFGYRSKSVICPAYVWDEKLEDILARNGVSFLQGTSFQQYTNYVQVVKKRKGKYHFCGQKNRNNQIYLVRNVFFEPSSFPYIDFYDDCMSRIDISFKCFKPAIISMHRLNFVSALNVKNRDNNLMLFEKILRGIVKKWPDVEFMSSDSLGCLVENKTKASAIA